MTVDAFVNVPVLTEAVAQRSDAVAEPGDDTLRVQSISLTRHQNRVVPTSDREMLIAELQTELAASVFALADRIMRQAFAEMEASIFQQISGRLRSELPETIDELLRERLGDETEY